MPRDDPKIEDVSNKVQDGKKDTNMKEGEKYQSLFSLENEISMINISVPFSDLLKNVEYRKQKYKNAQNTK